jgi:outer membrane protein assembly factor BamB
MQKDPAWLASQAAYIQSQVAEINRQLADMHNGAVAGGLDQNLSVKPDADGELSTTRETMGIITHQKRVKKPGEQPIREHQTIQPLPDVCFVFSCGTSGDGPLRVGLVNKSNGNIKWATMLSLDGDYENDNPSVACTLTHVFVAFGGYDSSYSNYVRRIWCLKKSTGALVWQDRITDPYDIGINTIVANDNVAVVLCHHADASYNYYNTLNILTSSGVVPGDALLVTSSAFNSSIVSLDIYKNNVYCCIEDDWGATTTWQVRKYNMIDNISLDYAWGSIVSTNYTPYLAARNRGATALSYPSGSFRFDIYTPIDGTLYSSIIGTALPSNMAMSGKYVLSDGGGLLHCYKIIPTNMELLWTKPVGAMSNAISGKSIATSDGDVFWQEDSDVFIYCAKTSTGAIKWTTDVSGGETISLQGNLALAPKAPVIY